MEEEKIKVRILPLKGIGGIGETGDVVLMSREDAEMYFRDGYVEYVDEQAPAKSNAPPKNEDSPAEDHKVMKPQSKRGR